MKLCTNQQPGAEVSDWLIVSSHPKTPVSLRQDCIREATSLTDVMADNEHVKAEVLQSCRASRRVFKNPVILLKSAQSSLLNPDSFAGISEASSKPFFYLIGKRLYQNTISLQLRYHIV